MYSGTDTLKLRPSTAASNARDVYPPQKRENVVILIRRYSVADKRHERELWYLPYAHSARNYFKFLRGERTSCQEKKNDIKQTIVNCEQILSTILYILL